MMQLRLIILLLLVGIGTAARADNVSCPTLSTAVQVAACPSEDELRVTYIGYCSDDARAYNLADMDTCVNYESYRRRKNVALWEVGDRFQGYLSCDLPADTVRQLKPAGIAVKTQGTLTRVVCTYPQGITFVHRTKEQCTVEGSGNCEADPAACKASCEK
jgi:hypothetical protein